VSGGGGDCNPPKKGVQVASDPDQKRTRKKSETVKS